MTGSTRADGGATPSAGLKRATFLVTTLTRGGAENQVRALALGLRRRSWSVQVIPMKAPDAYVEELAEAGVDVATLGMRRRIPSPMDYARLVRLLRAFRPAVLHGHMYRANLLARGARHLARVPVVISTAHNIWEGGSRSDRRGPTEWAYRLTNPWSDLTTNVSRTAVERYVRTGAAPRDRIRYVPNGLDLDAFAPDPERRAASRLRLGLAPGDLAYLAAGRLHPQKDYPTLLEAFARVHERLPHARLLIAGVGPEERTLRALHARLGLGEAARFLGLRDDVPDLLDAADVYVMSSRWEGLPLVLLEASAMALPVVATDVGGNAEVVEDGVTGLLVPPGRVDALASALERVARLPEADRRALGEAGRKRIAAEYDLERVLDMWELIYGELLARKGALRAAG